MKTYSRIALGLGAAAVATGAAIGVGTLVQADDAATSKPSAAPTTAAPTAGSTPSTQDDQGRTGHRGRHGHPGMGHGMRGMEEGMTADLAKKLGLDAAKVETAVQNARQATRPEKPADGSKPSEADRTAHQAAFAKALAKELDLDESKVTGALEQLRDERRAERLSGLEDRLAQAVKDGKLTQAESDAVKKAAEAGVIGMGGHGSR